MCLRIINKMQKIIISGFGGQGVVLASNVLAQTALAENKNITAMVSYGAEMRGGTAHCMITISDGEIASPVFENPDVVLILNQPSLDKFEDKVEKGGLLVLNSSLTERDPKRTDIESVKIPATDIATELGNVKIANMVLLGAFLKKTNLLDLNKTIEILPKAFPKNKQDLIEINIKALKKGVELVLKN